jgi:hypothetical protein
MDPIERILWLVLTAGSVSLTALLLWPVAYAIGRLRGEYGPAGRLCELPRCNAPARADTGRCEFHTATMPIRAARGKLRKLGVVAPEEVIPNRRRPPAQRPA